MAISVSLSNYSPIAPPISASFSSSSSSSSSKPTNTLESKALTLRYLHHRPPVLKGVLGFSLSHSYPVANNIGNFKRRNFKSSFSARESAPSTNNREEDYQDVEVSESEADRKHLSSLQTLMRVYREALFHGDQKTVSAIEARIDIIEQDKNELEQKVSALMAEITSGKEKYIRLQADFENFRKRSDKERLTIHSNARGEVIENLLPMVDSFERAKQQIKPETEREKKIDTSYQGIYKQFVEIMRSLRVAAVATVGKPFDPSLHEAIAREESQEFKEGTVTQELRRGFLLGDQLLRPAMVKVSAGPGPKKASASTGQPATAAGMSEQ